MARRARQRGLRSADAPACAVAATWAPTVGPGGSNMLAAQRRERAPIRSECQQRWGRPAAA
jgi:hypothetical protein